MKQMIAVLILTLSYPGFVTAGLITLDGKFQVEGEAISTFQTYSGNTSGVMVDLGEGPTASGEISFELDPGKISTWTLDFSNNLQIYDLNLLITFPLQQDIGAPAIPINVVETGVIQAFNVSNGGMLDVVTSHDGVIRQPLLPDQATVGAGTGTFIDPDDPIFLDFNETILSGGGIVTSGPFTGFAFENGQRVEKITISIPGISIEIVRTPVPEPATALLFSCGLVAFLAMAGRRRRRQSEGRDVLIHHRDRDSHHVSIRNSERLVDAILNHSRQAQRLL